MDNYTCKHCGVSVAWDEIFEEWFHVEEPTRGEYAIFCSGTAGTMAEAY